MGDLKYLLWVLDAMNVVWYPISRLFCITSCSCCDIKRIYKIYFIALKVLNHIVIVRLRLQFRFVVVNVLFDSHVRSEYYSYVCHIFLRLSMLSLYAVVWQDYWHSVFPHTCFALRLYLVILFSCLLRLKCEHSHIHGDDYTFVITRSSALAL